MKLKFFWIPAAEPEREAALLNAFLSGHRILHLEKQFSAEPGRCGWAIAVEYLDGKETAAARSGNAKPRIDYKEVLDAETFLIYSDLREWRKAAALKEGIPPYSVATNEQLATVARDRITETGRLKKIPGFGTSRIEKYGETLPARCRQAIESAHPPTPAS